MRLVPVDRVGGHEGLAAVLAREVALIKGGCNIRTRQVRQGRKSWRLLKWEVERNWRRDKASSDVLTQGLGHFHLLFQVVL